VKSVPLESRPVAEAADEDRQTTLNGVPVTYEVRRSDRARRSRIDVDLRGVCVVVPTGSQTDPESLLAEHADWVLEKDAEYATERARIPERRFEPGATFPYRGAPHEVVVERRSTSVVEADTLRLARHHVVETSVKRALECLYRRTAREAFTEVAEAYAPRMAVDYERIEVRNQRTRWGSCSSNGTLSLNWRLVMGPPDVLEYVVVHELAHLQESNHSEAFWSIVAEQLPDYEERRAWLRENRVELVFTEADL
jgi:predicted metal-dependent hydrolase